MNRPTSPAEAPGPVRTCVGCRRRDARTELLRVTAGTDIDGRPAVVPDPRGVAPGRGAHLHPTTACLDAAIRRRAFARALRVGDGPGLSTEQLAQQISTIGTTPSTTPQVPTPSGPTDQDWSSSS